MPRLALVLCTLAACADHIDHPAEPPDAGSSPTGKVATSRGSDGTYTTTLDATSMTDWTYLDFETGMEADPATAWDLRVQRFHISTNGGVTGDGGVKVAPVETTFAAMTAAPSDGWISDAADANGDGIPDYAFDQGDGWYAYDEATHLLAPRSIVYAIQTDGGSSLKLAIDSYYDTAGTGGHFSFHWAPL